jgi:hypothetical protein
MLWYKSRKAARRRRDQVFSRYSFLTTHSSAALSDQLGVTEYWSSRRFRHLIVEWLAKVKAYCRSAPPSLLATAASSWFIRPESHLRYARSTLQASRKVCGTALNSGTERIHIPVAVNVTSSACRSASDYPHPGSQVGLGS